MNVPKMRVTFKNFVGTFLLFYKVKPAYPLGAHGLETDHSRQDSVCEPTKYEQHATQSLAVYQEWAESKFRHHAMGAPLVVC